MRGPILHVNLVGLAAAVEEARDRGLRSRPFVVARPEAPRAVVLDLSPTAHREGLEAGMLLSRALGRLPGLEVVRARPELYRAADKALWELGLAYTPLVERAGRGHLFIDLTGTGRLHGAPADAARRLRLSILERLGVSPSMALASNKTTAKVATRVFRPGGFVALDSGEEGEIVRMQPVSLLPGVGPILKARLSLLEIGDIGSLADLAPSQARALGPRGPELVARAGGLDDSPVDPSPLERRNFEASTLFEPDSSDPSLLRLGLFRVVDALGFAVRRASLGVHRVGVALEYTDGGRSFSSRSSPRLLVRDEELAAAAWSSLKAALVRRVRVRRLSLRLSWLGAGGAELDLFEPAETRRARLQAALDSVHGKYGFASLMSCALLGAGASLAVERTE